LVIEYAGMNPTRLVFALMAGGCLLRPGPLTAQETAPPYVMEKHYSSDLTITTKDGMTIPSKTFVDDDKMRSDASMNGMDMSFIVRKDQKKVYQVLVAQKMVMEMPYDEEKFKERTGGSMGPEGKFDLIGAEAVDGVACTKYKVTSDKGKVFFFWLDAARKVPAQMSAADGSFTVKWKNFKAGPQDAALFEIPAGFQVMPVMGHPNLPGAGGQ
jgi:hypothetical protein